jgi:hypothetical protein
MMGWRARLGFLVPPGVSLHFSRLVATSLITAP